MKKVDIDSCEMNELHEERIAQARNDLIKDEQLKSMAELYKLFSDFSRVKLLYLLAQNELCVCDLTALMDINQSAVSNQLRILRNSKLIGYRKEGKNAYYYLLDDCVKDILQVGRKHTQTHLE